MHMPNYYCYVNVCVALQLHDLYDALIFEPVQIALYIFSLGITMKCLDQKMQLLHHYLIGFENQAMPTTVNFNSIWASIEHDAIVTFSTQIFHSLANLMTKFKTIYNGISFFAPDSKYFPSNKMHRQHFLRHFSFNIQILVRQNHLKLQLLFTVDQLIKLFYNIYQSMANYMHRRPAKSLFSISRGRGLMFRKL